MRTLPQKPDTPQRGRNAGIGFGLIIGTGCALGVALHDLTLGIGIGGTTGAGSSRSCRRRSDDEPR